MNWLEKHRTPVLLNLILVLLAAACFAGYGIIAGTLHHIDSAKNWAGEGELFYSYISCFMPVNEKIDENAVYSFKDTVNGKMVEASLEAKEGASLWNFAYSGTGMINVSTNRGSASVNATGIGGDFFFFHRPYLRDGNYISGSDLMKDRVVIDKDLAWTLFGATEVAGMEVLIGGGRYIVAGVIEPETDFASKAAKTANGGLYMSYEKLEELTGAGIECYEAVIPSPVKNFAINIAKESFPAQNHEVVEVSERYSIKNIAKVIASFGKRSMRSDGIVFPEWENAARLTEDYCAAFLIFGAAFAIVPVGFGAVLAYKNARIYAKKLGIFAKQKAEKLYDTYNNKLYEREQKLKNREE
ncbi:MAG: ABC transporter permease [Oscillospiraceae bacterium]|nr:ABC transporter permease [Oscillospiraceae bacterium]MBQ3560634.1 ABC transporter permease [Oscillospiraceae bacterium]